MDGTPFTARQRERRLPDAQFEMVEVRSWSRAGSTNSSPSVGYLARTCPSAIVALALDQMSRVQVRCWPRMNAPAVVLN
jgi:hypothetical protein